MKKRVFQTIKEMLLIVMISGLLAIVVNLFHPHRIPWMQDWGRHIESLARDDGIEVIPLRRAFELFQDNTHLFVDARDSSSYEAGHIPRAISLSFETLNDQLGALEQVLDASAPLVVYCSDTECDSALLLAQELIAMGQTNLVLFVDGFKAWEANGGLIE